ncbi:MAG: glycosyltransferase family 1 protein, partial [Candidatus Aminicenantes bacterium]|nr:glycosyltransferase family 1 protein [Candidatus Aminicenantes bacterium]
DSLKGQCLRANGGLYYENYDEFKEALNLLLSDAKLRELLGLKGHEYFRENYLWEVIENKYLKIVEKIEEARRT